MTNIGNGLEARDIGMPKRMERWHESSHVGRDFNPNIWEDCELLDRAFYV